MILLRMKKRWGIFYILVSRSVISGVSTLKESNILIIILRNHKSYHFKYTSLIKLG